MEHKNLNMDNPPDHPEEARLKELVEIVRQRVLETDCPLKRRTDASFLVKFIRSKRYNVDKAATAVNKYYINLHANLRLVDGILPAKFSDAYKMNSLNLLKYNFEGAKVIHAEVRKWDTSIASLRDVEIAASFLLEEIFQDKQFQLYGSQVILDLSGLSFSHVRQASYSEIKFIIQTGLQMFPLKVAGVHVLNAPALIWPIYKVAVQFLPQKIRDRIFFHRNLRELNKALSPDILPKFLGGNIEDGEAFDMEFIPSVVQRNLPYDWYWNGAMERPYQPRRLTRKRSSMVMS